ncbi:hypothetical protein RB195_020081 [Necator americanus]|uniref:CHK kinase-like domain-containing protein n=2 Tax=Necator americanus TaxID=51031 RepID=A0ABR1CIP3_NECAM
MSLYTPADGLFGTHVTWEDVEEDMQREFDTDAFFGPNKTAKSIGDGNGFLSMVVLIEPDWQSKDKELPESFIIKIVSQLPIQKFVEHISKEKNIENRFGSPEFMATLDKTQKKFHNMEVTVYDHLKKIPKGVIPVAEVWYARRFTESNPLKGYLIMEYLNNIKAVHIFENVPLKSMEQVLRAKAALEALSLRFTSEEKKQFTANFTEVFADFYTEEAVEDVVKYFRDFGDKKFQEKINKLEKALPNLLDFPAVERLADEIGMQRVLCHGDLWSMNLLWRPSGDDLNLAAMIDYQLAHMGCAATDLVRVFSACLSGKDRQEHWEKLLEEFYEYLSEEVSDTKMPYTLEQLKESYRQSFPLCAFLIVPMIGPMFEMLCKNSEDEKQREFLGMATEKSECLLDDILYFHERNMKLTNGKLLN